MIRLACPEDLASVLTVYQAAREFMAATGNPHQWGTVYPEKELLLQDMASSHLYVEEHDGVIHGVFAFILGEDPTYGVIDEGQWLDDSPYGTIHRVASDGSFPGFFARCAAFCAALYPHLRVDTHRDNRVMQHVAEMQGFIRCGTVYVADGTPRIAYERRNSEV